MRSQKRLAVLISIGVCLFLSSSAFATGIRTISLAGTITDTVGVGNSGLSLQFTTPGDPIYAVIDFVTASTFTISWGYPAQHIDYTEGGLGTIMLSGGASDFLSFYGFNRPAAFGGFGYMDVAFNLPANTLQGVSCNPCMPDQVATAMPLINFFTATANIAVQEQTNLLTGTLGVVTVTPEPSTWLLLATGLFGIVIARRRRYIQPSRGSTSSRSALWPSSARRLITSFESKS